MVTIRESYPLDKKLERGKKYRIDGLQLEYYRPFREEEDVYEFKNISYDEEKFKKDPENELWQTVCFEGNFLREIGL